MEEVTYDHANACFTHYCRRKTCNTCKYGTRNYKSQNYSCEVLYYKDHYNLVKKG